MNAKLLAPLPLLAILGSAIFLQGAATVPQIYGPSAIPGDAGLTSTNVIFDSPLTGKRDTNGRIHIGLTEPIYGFGLVSVSSDSTPTQVLVDTSVIMHLVDAPTAPGPCLGTADEAIDAQLFRYYCVIQGGTLQWARESQPLVTNWAQ